METKERLNVKYDIDYKVMHVESAATRNLEKTLEVRGCLTCLETLAMMPSL